MTLFLAWSFGFLLFLTLCVLRADFSASRENMNTGANGLGSVPGILAGRADSPMQRRVLVPWLCWLFSKRPIGRNFYSADVKRAYFRIRWVSVFLALYASWQWFALCLSPQASFLAVSLLALYFVLATRHDYTDVYLEVFFFATAFTVISRFSTLCPLDAVVMTYIGLPILTFAAVLNRETAMFIPTVLAIQKTAPWWPTAVAAIFACFLPFLIYGERNRYCEFTMFKTNWRRFWHYRQQVAWVYNPCLYFILLFCTTVCLYARELMLYGTLSPVETVMGIFFVILLVPSIWYEIRVFAPMLLATIPMALEVLGGVPFVQ